jgi:hypothetical protein
MDYKIQPYTLEKAKQLGVKVAPSNRAGKKLDVFKNGERVASIGASGMGDYPTYLKNEGKAYADERRRLYRVRHSKNKGVAGFYASNLLW